MRTAILLTALAVAASVLSVAPAATALESPPQCQTIGSGCCGIEPAFAPCCSIVECPPPVACPETRFDSTDYLQFAGPWVTAATHYGCSAEACLQPTTCCYLDGRASRCTSLSVATSAIEPPNPCGPTALCQGPCPSTPYDDGLLRIEVGPDCHVLVEYKPYDCVWNCGWVTYVQGPPVTVRVFQQLPPEESSATSASSPPNCTSWEIVSEGLPATIGVRSGSDCRYGVYVIDPQCPGPTAPGPGTHVDGVVSVYVEACRPDLTCTCDPLPIDLEPAAPSAYICPEVAVSTSQFFGYLGPHAGVAVHSDCTVDVWEAGLVCASLLPDPGHVGRTVGPLEIDADTCAPDLDCTCPPLMAAAAIPPPVEVEWVVCVTEPCPSPRITCHVAPRDLALFTVTVSESCHVTLTQAPVPCEGLRYESHTVGPVTVRRAYCGPGIDP